MTWAPEWQQMTWAPECHVLVFLRGIEAAVVAGLLKCSTANDCCLIARCECGFLRRVLGSKKKKIIALGQINLASSS
jgi:hypothetical protein